MPTIKILAVDDEADILRYISKCLSKEGFSVVTSENPVQALSLANAQDFDVVLSDIRMAEMDGLDFLAQMKEKHPASKVILMTGHAAVETAIRAMKIGAFDYLIKPFLADELVAAVQRAVQFHESARRPLSSLKAASYMLLREFHDAGDASAGATGNTDPMIDLVDDLLEVFRLQSNKIKLDYVPVSVRQMVEECVEILDASCRERGLTLASELEKNLPAAQVDAKKLRQALLNLLGNAMKFTNRGGKITLGARKLLPSGIEIYVKDSGIGVPADQQQKIFNIFHQVDHSSFRRKPGLRLGLALTKAIVNAHGGSLNISSTPGYGSTFTIRLPAVPPRKPPGKEGKCYPFFINEESESFLPFDLVPGTA